MNVVLDSSPLIFLSGLNVVDQAFDLFSNAAVPPYVQHEILTKEDQASAKFYGLVGSRKIKVVQPKNGRMVEALRRRLGRGESEAIVLAVELAADLVILDDHPARKQAKSLGLNVRGTLGIIKRLMDLRIIEYDLDKLYRDLGRMNFRVRKNVFEQIFRM